MDRGGHGRHKLTGARLDDSKQARQSLQDWPDLHVSGLCMTTAQTDHKFTAKPKRRLGKSLLH